MDNFINKSIYLYLPGVRDGCRGFLCDWYLWERLNGIWNMKKSNIYIGEVIKPVIAEKQVTKAELARRLGVKPQSVDYLLTRKSIDTDTLYSLSLALDYDFAVLYSIKKEHALATDEESPFKVGNAKISLEIELRPDEMLKLNLKQKIADLLEGKGK